MKRILKGIHLTQHFLAGRIHLKFTLTYTHDKSNYPNLLYCRK